MSHIHSGLIEGLPAVGYAPCYGVFPSQPAERITLTGVLSGCEAHNYQILSTLKPGKDDQFLLEQSTKDAARGFCTPPLTLAQLRQQLHGQPYRLIPRCVITQSSGKQRIIDNADAGGQTLRSSDANKLVLCSPPQTGPTHQPSPTPYEPTRASPSSGYRHLGVRWGRLAGCLSAQSYGGQRNAGMRGHFLAS